MAATNRVLSVAPAELATAIERLQAENKAIGRTARALQEQLAGHVAAALVANGNIVNGRLVVVQALEGWEALA